MQLMKFKTNEEAVTRANDSKYGLAAGVCSRDMGNALSIAHDLDAGTVWCAPPLPSPLPAQFPRGPVLTALVRAGPLRINCYDNFDMACPFGGTKESGWGREKGEYALENYTNVKLVMVPMGP